MTPSADASLLARLAAEIADQPDQAQTVEAIVGSAVRVVPDADHVSLTVRQGGGFTTLAATTTRAESLDQLQYDLREGPCLDATEHAEWFRTGDIARDPRWPRWGPEAAGLGVRSLLSVRLVASGTPVGALNMYADDAGRFAEPHAVDLALLYAIHVAHALTAARLVSDLETALDSRHTIGLAQGILMERYSVDAVVSFQILQRVSSTENRKLRELASELVDTRTLEGLGGGTPA